MNFSYKGIIFGLSTIVFYYFYKNNDILSYIVYQTMFYYSYVEINVKKHIDLIYNNPIVKNSIHQIQYYMFNEVELVKSNYVFNTCKLTEVIRYNPNYFDFFIFTDYYTSNKIVSKDVNRILNVEKCDYRFLIINVKISNVDLIDDEKSFIVDLNQYYIVGNVIQKYLICFLIYRQYKVYIDPERVNYSIELMDNNMNYKTITEKEEIILNKESYMIRNICDDAPDKISDNMTFRNSDEDYFISDSDE
jgi:hypothetical protein